MASSSSRRATTRKRSSITELALHGIHTSRITKAGKCNPYVRYVLSPVLRGQKPKSMEPDFLPTHQPTSRRQWTVPCARRAEEERDVRMRLEKKRRRHSGPC